VDEENPSLTGRKEVVFLANLCAYQFWQRIFKVNDVLLACTEAKRLSVLIKWSDE